MGRKVIAPDAGKPLTPDMLPDPLRKHVLRWLEENPDGELQIAFGYDGPADGVECDCCHSPAVWCVRATTKTHFVITEVKIHTEFPNGYALPTTYTTPKVLFFCADPESCRLKAATMQHTD